MHSIKQMSMALLVTVLRSFLESELNQLGTERSKIAKDAAEFLLENSHHPALERAYEATGCGHCYSCGEET